MRILITGINGFIAGSLGEYLAHERGHGIRGTLRKETPKREWCEETCYFELGKELSPGMLDGVDTVVHAAHDFRKGAGEINIRATRSLALAALESGVKRQVYISSYSAREDAVSEYGQTKYALERFFITVRGISVRPGVVVGSGGIFLRIAGLVKRFPVVPLLDAGRGDVPVIGTDNLNEALGKIIEGPEPEAVYNLINREHSSLKAIVQAICKAKGYRRLCLPVPSSLVISPLAFLKKLGIGTPIDIDNVRAFIRNQTTEYESDLGRLGICESTVEEMVAKALR
ncbi:MAG: hypothetical protein U9N45_00785 [Gemmatimonadota bacterium]|nr:hypothetical protein [Gemmatimonadota bacterium]